jgi:hypothetical protein
MIDSLLNPLFSILLISGTGNISDNIVILNPGEYNGTGNVNLFVKCRG